MRADFTSCDVFTQGYSDPATYTSSFVFPIIRVGNWSTLALYTLFGPKRQERDYLQSDFTDPL